MKLCDKFICQNFVDVTHPKINHFHVHFHFQCNDNHFLSKPSIISFILLSSLRDILVLNVRARLHEIRSELEPV